MNLPFETPAKLVCINSAMVCACAGCQTRPGFYKIVWAIPPAMQGDTVALGKLQRHPLFGKVICAN
jgi:hypothetical protein